MCRDNRQTGFLGNPFHLMDIGFFAGMPRTLHFQIESTREDVHPPTGVAFRSVRIPDFQCLANIPHHRTGQRNHAGIPSVPLQVSQPFTPDFRPPFVLVLKPCLSQQFTEVVIPLVCPDKQQQA